ncbi:MAG: hypothetical protein JSW60_09205 [Thermoplasmatales archaeon]|nr:MAG: hypothetical protein JSW60_09205 [Thermoplasmatales archaeon]
MNPFTILAAFIMAPIFYMPTVVTDHEFDKKVGLKTSAVVFGLKKILQAMYLLTIMLVIIRLMLFLFFNVELKMFALLIIIYTIVFTVASHSRIKEERLYLHENWILIPFALISAAFIIYGFLKLSGLIMLR